MTATAKQQKQNTVAAYCVAQEVGVEAPAGWIRQGGTGYLDSQTEEDLTKLNSSVVYGKDEYGRRFITMKLWSHSVERRTKFVDDEFMEGQFEVSVEDHHAVITFFERYTNSGIWVKGGGCTGGAFTSSLDEAELEALSRLLTEGSAELYNEGWETGSYRRTFVQRS